MKILKIKTEFSKKEKMNFLKVVHLQKVLQVVIQNPIVIPKNILIVIHTPIIYPTKIHHLTLIETGIKMIILNPIQMIGMDLMMIVVKNLIFHLKMKKFKTL